MGNNPTKSCGGKSMTGPTDKSIIIKDISKNKPQKVWGKGPVRIFDVELDCRKERIKYAHRAYKQRIRDSIK